MDTPTPPPGYVLLKFGDVIKMGDLIYLEDRQWLPAQIYGSTVNMATFCRPIPKEQQPDKEWLNPWD